MKIHFSRFAVVVLMTLLSSFVAFAQAQERREEKFDFYTRGTYRAEVPRPQSLLRFDVGDFHTTYAQMENVIAQIAKAAPDRVKIFDIGTTNENRMQHIVAISSPENIARLDQIKANLARLSDPRSLSASEASQIAQNTPLAVWLAYTIHGNESSSFETMMQVVYQLAASDEPATQEILKNTVTLIVTGENPDGHERFATWYNSVATGNADRNALEHREPWSIYGRLSHFRFDLNRDNIASTQRETQNLQRAFLDWNPQVSADLHGQPSQYFFPPDSLPINPNFPAQTGKWLEVFGRANAAQFDSRQWDFYVRDIFDLFYPGYWDSYPALNGATAMTYETDGGGFKGLNWTQDDGTISTFRRSIAKHYVTSLTTLEVAARNREARLRDFYEFKRSAIEEGKTERMKRIIISPEKDRVKTAELVEVLRRAHIEVKVASSNFRVTSAHSYDDKNAAATAKDFAAGTYIVDLAQPQKRLAKALLEQDTPQDPAFVKDQTDKLKRNQLRGSNANREDYGFYDITSWNLPLAFGVDAFWTETASNDFPLVTDEYIAAQKVGNVIGGRAQIAYIIPYQTDASAILAYRLEKEGYKVAVALKQLNAANQNFPRGTFVVRCSRNPESLHEAIIRLSKELGANVQAVQTGFQESGDTGVNGENVVSLKLPRIAIVADEGIEQTSYGSIWWTFNRYGIEFTPLTLANIRNGALEKYNLLIMPDGSASRYSSQLGKDGVETIKSWLGRGGSLVTVKGAAVFAALKDVNLSSTKIVGSADDDEKATAEDVEKKLPTTTTENDAKKETPTTTTKTGKNKKPTVTTDAGENEQTQELPFDKADGAPPELPPIASPSATKGKVPEAVPGAIMRGTVDRTTWLTYGIEQNNLPVLVDSAYFFRLSKEGTNAIVFEQTPKKPLTISGFTWDGNTERLLKGTAYVIDEPQGQGHVILFAEEPFFRGIFRSNSRMFFNSLLFPSTL